MSTTEEKPFNIVLVEPEIPPNTGSVSRLCGATNTILHLVHPLGFSTDNKHMKRAGLDYWQFVNIVYWENLDAFLQAQDESRLFFFQYKSRCPVFHRSFPTRRFFYFRKGNKRITCRYPRTLQGKMLYVADAESAYPQPEPCHDCGYCPL